MSFRLFIRLTPRLMPMMEPTRVSATLVFRNELAVPGTPAEQRRENGYSQHDEAPGRTAVGIASAAATFADSACNCEQC